MVRGDNKVVWNIYSLDGCILSLFECAYFVGKYSSTFSEEIKLEELKAHSN